MNRLLLKYGKEVLRNCFDAEYRPDELKDFLSGDKISQTLTNLFDKGILTTHQKRKLYPDDPSTVSSANFDITLLAMLLRNICSFSDPEDDMWKRPRRRDNSTEANIARLRIYKNKISSHSVDPSLTDAAFETYWRNITKAIIALGGEERYASLISQLKTEPLDSGAEILSQGLPEKKQELEDLKGIAQSHVTIAEFEEVKGVVWSHVESTSADLTEMKRTMQSHVNSTSAEFKEVKGMIKSHTASTTSFLRNLNGIVQSHFKSTSAEFEEVKGTLTANQERTEKLLQELLERGVTHRGAENAPKLSKDLK